MPFSIPASCSAALAYLLAGNLFAQPAAPAYDAAFWRIWGDGQAELSAYEFVKTHYREPRRGVAVAIFVTEPFSNSKRVKADAGKHPKEDVFPVMKLNLVKDFQTGIYDYNDQTSAFLALAAVNGRPAGTLTKLSFSSQEWCGNVYHQLLFDQKSIRLTRHSYFDGEADQQGELPYPQGGIAEDALFFWARNLAEPFGVKKGEFALRPVLTSAQRMRDTHQPQAWIQSRFSRAPVTQKLIVPAGTFDVEKLTVQLEDFKWTFWVEAQAPHRIVKWENSAGESGLLLGSERMRYWELNGKGKEEMLRRIKLNARPPRTT
jgi:hypothetical protein